MPRFDPVEVTRSLPATVPVPQVSPEAMGAGVGRSLAQLGGVLTASGQQRMQEAARLRDEREVTEWSTTLAEQSLAVRDQIRRETDPDRLAEVRETYRMALDETVETIERPAVREAVRRRAAAYGLTVLGDVADRTFALEVDRGRAALLAGIATRQRLAISDPNPVARGLAEAEIDAAISEAVSLGLVTAEQGVTERAKARRAITAGRVEAAIRQDPTAAIARLQDRADPLTAPLAEDERLTALDQARTLERQRLSEALTLEKALDARLEKARTATEERLERETYLAGFAAGTPPPMAQFLGDLQSGALQGEASRRVAALYEKARTEPRKSNPDVLGALAYRIATGDPTLTRDAIHRQIGPTGLTFADAATLVDDLAKRADFDGDPQYRMGKTLLDTLRPSEFDQGARAQEQRSIYQNALLEWQLAWRAGRKDLPEAQAIFQRHLEVSRRADRRVVEVPSRFTSPQEAYQRLQAGEASEEEFNTYIEGVRRAQALEDAAEQARERRRGGARGEAR